MHDHAARFVGDVPRNYDLKLGPHLFCDYAVDLARRVAAANPHRVLEIAAGTGIVTRQLRDALPQTTHLVASDLNAPMLTIAQEKFGRAERVGFQTADATALPFADGSFEAVVCQFGIMFVPDKGRAHREAFRVLAPGGRYYFSVWDSFDFNPFARIAHETVAGFFVQAPPDFFAVPFGYHQIEFDQGLSARSGILRHVGARAEDRQDDFASKAFRSRADLWKPDHRGNRRPRHGSAGPDRRGGDGGAAARIRRGPRAHAAASDHLRSTERRLK